MATGKVFVYFFVVLFLSEQSVSRMTEKQLAAAVKLVRNMCLSKEKAKLEEVDKMHEGNWDIDHKTQCYMWCVLSQYKLIGKPNHFDRESANIQVDTLLPESMHDYVVGCLDKCENAATNFDDKCVAAYEYAKCLYFCNPKEYFLP
uniref:Odorant binding protein 3 n=1 Tax=Ips typographus TaxID=55986 RepID=M3V875_IPSTY